jgi:hypothetical protein
MRQCRFLLMLVMPVSLAQPAQAGIFFNKHPKHNPVTRVPALIMILRTDLDDTKRASAAEELRLYDPNAFPELLPALIDAAMRDPKVGVRLEAVQSVAKVRPISQQAGSALEQAVEKDPSLRVRLQARSSLMQYHLSGYRSTKGPELPGAGIKTEEPPLAAPVIEQPVPTSALSPGQPAALDPGLRKSAPGILRPVGARPMPIGPPLVPTPAPVNDGPELAPPK